MISQQEDAFNTALGKRLTLLRQAQRLSQKRLGDYLGVRAQQVHKYETGATRLSPARLHQCAELFNVSMGYLCGASDHVGCDNTEVMQIATALYALPPDVCQSVVQLSQTVAGHLPESSDKLGSP